MLCQYSHKFFRKEVKSVKSCIVRNHSVIVQSQSLSTSDNTSSQGTKNKTFIYVVIIKSIEFFYIIPNHYNTAINWVNVAGNAIHSDRSRIWPKNKRHIPGAEIQRIWGFQPEDYCVSNDYELHFFWSNLDKTFQRCFALAFENQMATRTW